MVFFQMIITGTGVAVKPFQYLRFFVWWIKRLVEVLQKRLQRLINI